MAGLLSARQPELAQAGPDPSTLWRAVQDVIQTGVSAADRTMKAQLVGELRNLLERKVGG